MLKKTITYTDYNGDEVTEDFRFNLTKAEVAKLEITTPGGIEKYIQKISSERNGKLIMDIFESIILGAYGEISLDGKRFIKVDENGRRLSDKFFQTEAYSILFMELITDSDKAADFIKGVLPKTPNPNGTIPMPANS